MKRSYFFPVIFILVAGLLSMGPPLLAADSTPPASPVKLLFVHHSTGGNWLADPGGDQPYGGLGRALMDNNYFVSATNYGWGPFGIGDSTDIPDWPRWFTGGQSETILSALYGENGQNIGDFGSWPRLGTDPSGENTIIMFKSCFPNSDLYGNPGDPPASSPGDQYTVSNAKAVYNDLLNYFATRQDKLFVVITAPPQAENAYSQDYQTPAQRAANARAFTGWLVNDWLAGYPHGNVAVFDYYNVLTGTGNHHRWQSNAVEHVTAAGSSNFSVYPVDEWDSHPSTAGHTRATGEFVPLLNYFYSRWKEGGGEPPPVDDGDTPPPVEQIPPACLVTANGSASPGAITTAGEIRLAVSLDPGDFNGVEADWWVVAVPPGGAVLSLNPVTMTFGSGTFPVHSGGLQALSNLPLTTLTAPVQGVHAFYFGVDTRMNGVLDLDLLSYAGVSIVVNAEASDDGDIPTGRLQPSDLTYRGAFRLPDRAPDAPDREGWEYAGQALTYRPDGDPGGGGDGHPGSLFGTGHDVWNDVSEISIPAPSLSRELDQLETAGTLQGFHDVRGGLFTGLDEMPRVGLQYLPAQEGQSSPRLYLAWGAHHHDEGSPSDTPSHALCDIDLANPDTKGAWWIGDTPLYRVTGYLFEIPENWADTHVGGARLATGRYRDGGWSGMGPNLYAYGPWLDGNPPAPGSRLSTRELLAYDFIGGEHRLNNYNDADEWEGGAFLTTEEKSAVVFVGTKGGGDYWWYGYAHPAGGGAPCPHIPLPGEDVVRCFRADGTDCPEELLSCTGYDPVGKGWWSSRFDSQILFYDPDDFVRVQGGTMAPYEPQPYASLDMDEHLFLRGDAVPGVGVDCGTGDQRKCRLGETAYDRENGFLYILERFADGAKPVVHVWAIAK